MASPRARFVSGFERVHGNECCSSAAWVGASRTNPMPQSHARVCCCIADDAFIQHGWSDSLSEQSVGGITKAATEAVHGRPSTVDETAWLKKFLDVRWARGAGTVLWIMALHGHMHPDSPAPVTTTAKNAASRLPPCTTPLARCSAGAKFSPATAKCGWIPLTEWTSIETF